MNSNQHLHRLHDTLSVVYGRSPHVRTHPFFFRVRNRPNFKHHHTTIHTAALPASSSLKHLKAGQEWWLTMSLHARLSNETMMISKIRRPPPVRPPCAVFTSAAQSTCIMSYRPDVVPRWSQMTGNRFPTYKTLIQGVGTPWLAIVS